MKKSNLLTISVSGKMEPIARMDWLPTNLPTLVTVAILLSTAVVAYQILEAKKPPENKTLAWYVANPKAALAQNRQCFDNPQIQKTLDCVNSLEALEITHKGPNS